MKANYSFTKYLDYHKDKEDRESIRNIGLMVETVQYKVEY